MTDSEDLVRFGFAPGGYMNLCRDCRAELKLVCDAARFMGDKRAWRCPPHARAARDKWVQMDTAPLICDVVTGDAA